MKLIAKLERQSKKEMIEKNHKKEQFLFTAVDMAESSLFGEE